jgi:hypothetical protein
MLEIDALGFGLARLSDLDPRSYPPWRMRFRPAALGIARTVFLHSNQTRYPLTRGFSPSKNINRDSRRDSRIDNRRPKELPTVTTCRRDSKIAIPESGDHFRDDFLSEYATLRLLPTVRLPAQEPSKFQK